MWFRTALLLFLLLLVLRVIRDVTARLGAGNAEARGGSARPGTPEGVRPGNAAPGSGTGRNGASPADWPPGEITDVPYRETRTADRK